MTTKQRELETIARLWKVGRLLAGKTQVELSKVLGISQSSISKYESMALEPSASDWYQFCQFVGIDAHKTLSLGYIDGKKKFKHRLFSESLIKIPMQYRRDFLLKIRELVPFRQCFINDLGTERWKNFLEEHNIDDDMFYIYDFQVSFNLFLDMNNWGLAHGFNLIDEVKKYNRDLAFSGSFGEKYIKKKSSQDLIKEILDDQIYFHRVFTSVITLNDNQLIAHAEMTDEARDFFDEENLKSFMKYKVDSFNGILEKNFSSDQKIQVSETQKGLQLQLTA